MSETAKHEVARTLCNVIDLMSRPYFVYKADTAVTADMGRTILDDMKFMRETGNIVTPKSGTLEVVEPYFTRETINEMALTLTAYLRSEIE